MDVEMKKATHSVDKTLCIEAMTPISSAKFDNSTAENPLIEKISSPSSFLKRIMQLEKEEIKGNLGFVVLAVHAVFLESSFVLCSGDGSHLPKDWNLETTLVSVQYTVPELLCQIPERDDKFVTLKFSMTGNIVSVHGFLSINSELYQLCLNLSNVVPLLVVFSESNGSGEEEEKEVNKFWKAVKDGLCLPLLIDICMKNELPLPPCFARLPIELKVKILELLPGEAIARVGCTCSEMRHLTSNNELWKRKFIEEFKPRTELKVAQGMHWKDKFKFYVMKRRLKRFILLNQNQVLVGLVKNNVDSGRRRFGPS